MIISSVYYSRALTSRCVGEGRHQATSGAAEPTCARITLDDGALLSCFCIAHADRSMSQFLLVIGSRSVLSQRCLFDDGRRRRLSSACELQLQREIGLDLLHELDLCAELRGTDQSFLVQNPVRKSTSYLFIDLILLVSVSRRITNSQINRITSSASFLPLTQLGTLCVHRGR